MNTEMNNQEPNNKAIKLIEEIVSNRKDVNKAKKPVKDIPKEFNTEDFFTDTNPFGLMTKETFKRLIDTMSTSELKELQIVIEKLNNNEFFEYNAVPYGSGPIPKIYAQIGGWRGREKFTIPAVDNVPKFLAHYIALRFECKFSFEELYNSVK